jgi:hypothetical protein
LEPKTSQFLMGNLVQHGAGAETQVSLTLATAVAIVAVAFITGFLLGMVWCHWMTRRRR